MLAKCCFNFTLCICRLNQALLLHDFIFQSAFHAVCQNEPSAQVAAGALPVGICMIMLLEGVFIITLISSKRHIALHFKMIKRNS